MTNGKAELMEGSEWLRKKGNGDALCITLEVRNHQPFFPVARFNEEPLRFSEQKYPGIPLIPTAIEDKEAQDPQKVTSLTLEFASEEGRSPSALLIVSVELFYICVKRRRLIQLNF